MVGQCGVWPNESCKLRVLQYLQVPVAQHIQVNKHGEFPKWGIALISASEPMSLAQTRRLLATSQHKAEDPFALMQ